MIDLDAILRLVAQAVGAHADEQRILGRETEQLIAGLHQSRMAQADAIDELEVEAGRVAELECGRRRKADDLGILIALEVLVEPRDDLLDAIASARPIFPGLEHDERQAGSLAMPAIALAADCQRTLDGLRLLGAQVSRELIERVPDMRGRRPGGRGDLREHETEVLVR